MNRIPCPEAKHNLKNHKNWIKLLLAKNKLKNAPGRVEWTINMSENVFMFESKSLPSNCVRSLKFKLSFRVSLFLLRAHPVSKSRPLQKKINQKIPWTWTVKCNSGLHLPALLENEDLWNVLKSWAVCVVEFCYDFFVHDDLSITAFDAVIVCDIDFAVTGNYYKNEIHLFKFGFSKFVQNALKFL